MTVIVTKPAVNIREKLAELQLKKGITGYNILRSDTPSQAREYLNLEEHLFEDFESTGIDDNATSTQLTIDSNNNVGIGTTSPSYKLEVNGSISSNGTVYATHFDNVSDIKFKENVTEITSSKDIICSLNPVSFNWKDTGEKSFGLIAQEVEKILPEIVHYKTDETKTVSYIQLIPFLIQIIKEQQKQIDDINSKLTNA